MDFICCGCFKKRIVKIAMVGLDGSGKSSLIYLIRDEYPAAVTPTYGFNNHTITTNFKNYEISLFDLGGSKTIRGYWSNYYSEVHCIIFVVDGSDPNSFDESSEIFHKLTQHNDLQMKPMLFVCNKNDLSEFVPSKQIISRHFETHLWKGPFELIETSTKRKTFETMYNGLMSLLVSVHTNYKQLNKRTNAACKRHKEVQRQSISLQKQRVQEWKENDKKRMLSPPKISMLNKINMQRPHSAPQYIRKYGDITQDLDNFL